MAKLRSSNIEPSTGTTLTLGASGDTIAVSSDSVKANTWQDTGGNNLFVSDGAGTVSSVNAGLAGGGFTLISTNTVTNTTTDTITITGMDSTYDEYMFVCNDLRPTNNNMHWRFQVSTDGGSSFGVAVISAFFDARHSEAGTGGALSYQGTKDQEGQTTYQSFIISIGNDADQTGAGILHIYNPSNTTYVKNFVGRGSTYESTDYAGDNYVSGFFNTTSAINAISFQMDTANNIQNCVVQMYGVG